jgi:hypothetical protein
MHVKTYKHIAAVLCISALAIPAGVAAKGPTGDHGKSGDQHGKTQKAKPHHVNKRCKKQPKVGFTLGGTLDSSSTADAIVIDVTHANKHAKPFLTGASGSNLGTFAVPSGSNVKYEGSNPFTTSGANLSDYRAQVVGKVPKLKKGCTADNSPSPTIKKVTIHAPGSDDESGSNVSGSNVSGSNVSGSNLQD